MSFIIGVESGGGGGVRGGVGPLVGVIPEAIPT
jgi:hypothetical protein